MTCKINADTTNGLKVTSDTSGAIDFQSNGTTKVSMNSTGNLTLEHPDTPSITFTDTTNTVTGQISAGNSDFNIQTNTDHSIDIRPNNVRSMQLFDDTWIAYTGGTERMRINSSGDVGIGTTSPRNELTVDGIISGITVNTSSGNTNTTIKSGMSGAYLAFVTWNNGSGYATLHVSTALSSSGQIIASSNSSGGNNAFDVTNNFSSNSGNGIALFINGTNLNLQTKDNWSANAHPIRISLFGG